MGVAVVECRYWRRDGKHVGSHDRVLRRTLGLVVSNFRRLAGGAKKRWSFKYWVLAAIYFCITPGEDVQNPRFVADVICGGV